MNPILIDLPEIIETRQLILQMPSKNYGEKLYQAILDGYEDYIKWLNWSPILPTLESVEEDCRKHHAAFILREFIRYLIIDKNTNDIVGRCAFPAFQTNWLIPQFGISYFIRKSYRSKNYATEAAHALTMIAFKILKARKVEIYCDAENLASNKVPLKLGYELEYTQLGGWARQDNKLAELHTYSIFSSDNLSDLEVKW